MSVTVDEIKRYRETHGVGLLDARRILARRDRSERLNQITKHLTSWNPWRRAKAVRDMIDIIWEMNQ
jgi:hypothetical protein